MNRKFAWVVIGSFGLFFWLASILKAIHEPELLLIPIIIGAVALFYWAVYVILVEGQGMNPHPKKPKRKHPWNAPTQAAFEAELESKRIQRAEPRIGYDERSHKGQGLFGSGRGRQKR